MQEQDSGVQQSGESDLSVMMKMNNLAYAPPMDASVVNSRQILRLNFQNTGFTVGSGGQNVQMIINSGDFWVWSPGCAITFDIAVNSGTAIFNNTAGVFDGLSAFNLIDTYNHLHRSGDQLDTVTHVGPLAQMVLNYSEGEDIKNYQSLMGSGATIGTTAIRVVLPLSVVSGFWGSRQLIPAQLLAGSLLQLQFAPFLTAFKIAGGSPTQYTISNLSLILDCYDLFDSAKKALMVQMANVKTQGIQYCYGSWWNISQTTSSNALSFDFNYSCGRSILALGKSRLTTNINSGAQDSIGSEPYNYTNYRWRLGSSFIPLDQVGSSAESYFYTQNAFKNYKLMDLDYKCPLSVRIPFRDGSSTIAYTTGEGATAAASAVVAIAADLQRNQIVGAYSGQPTNNSRLLSLSATFSESSPRTYDLFLYHLRCANTMLDNVVVDK